MGCFTSRKTQSEISESTMGLRQGSSPYDPVRHDFQQRIGELQKQTEQKKAITDTDTLKMAQNTINQENGEIKKRVNDGSLTADHLVSLHQKTLEEVRRLIKAGADHVNIIAPNGNIEIEQKSGEPEITSPRDESQDKKILEAFRTKNKGKSITDKLEQANKDSNVLNALTDITIYYLKKALKLSPNDMSHYRSKVRDIYVHHGDRVSDAHTLYQYYDLQHRKDELKQMAFGKKQCKQAYNILSLNACQNRRYKKEVMKVLEAEELRRKHLVEKYGNLKLEKGGKRGKEKRMLDDLIKARKEKIETNRAFKLFNTFLEKSERDIINDKDIPKDERERRKDILKSARENFDRRYQHEAISRIDHTMEKHRIYQEHLIKKYGSHPLYGRANDIASDGGAILGVVSTTVGWTHAVPFIAA